MIFRERIANLQREEQTVFVSICKWVVEIEKETFVFVYFLYCLIEILAVCVVVLLT